MAKVLGLGGLFFKADNADAMRKWYADVLGISFFDWGGAWFGSEAFAAQPGSGTVFSPSSSGDYYEPSKREFMFNLVVDDLDGMLARCKEHGIEPVKLFPDEANGRFAHIMDPEGRKVELWEPKPFEAPTA